MRLPLGLTMANVFLLFYENIWLEKSEKEFKPAF